MASHHLHTHQVCKWCNQASASLLCRYHTLMYIAPWCTISIWHFAGYPLGLVTGFCMYLAASSISRFFPSFCCLHSCDCTPALPLPVPLSCSGPHAENFQGMIREMQRNAPLSVLQVRRGGAHAHQRCRCQGGAHPWQCCSEGSGLDIQSIRAHGRKELRAPSDRRLLGPWWSP